MQIPRARTLRLPLLWIALLLCAGRQLAAGAARQLELDEQLVNVSSETFTGDSLTVVTYNMLHGFGSRTNDASLEERLGLLARGIEQAIPDVVLLQEASVTPGRHGNVAERLRDMLNARLAGRGVTYNSVFAMANGSRLIGFWEGSAILSRFRILSADALVYHSQALIPPERRIALRARIATAAPGQGGPGPAIEIVSTHLTNTAARCQGKLVRTMQARELALWLEAGRSSEGAAQVVGGDFNDTPGSDTVRALAGSGFRDAWVEAGQGTNRASPLWAGASSTRQPSPIGGSITSSCAAPWSGRRARGCCSMPPPGPGRRGALERPITSA